MQKYMCVYTHVREYIYTETYTYIKIYIYVRKRQIHDGQI